MGRPTFHGCCRIVISRQLDQNFFVALARKKVLVVEDNDDLRTIFRLSLVAAGFEVCEASDGLHALRELENCLPDVLVLDLVLPSVDGFSIRAELAAHEETRKLPIVVVTGSIREVPGLNVAAVLRKPVATELLVAAVRNALSMGNRAVRD
jgi:DNA-binding response OmpR family regulator